MSAVILQAQPHLRWRQRVSWVGLLAMTLTSCDFSVSNPGPIQDSFLDNEAAHAAVVAGMRFATSQAVWINGFYGAEATREYVTAGRIYVIKLPIIPGQLTIQQIPADVWNNSVRARWVAEDGTRRIREATGPEFNSSKLGAEALVHSGFANRLLGDNFCEAVIDGGPIEPNTVYYKRAEDHFTEAIAVAQGAGADHALLAAYAGRASARAALGNWNGAVADAAQVPDNFVHQAEYYSANEAYYNLIYFSNANEPYRAHSMVTTYYEDYYASTGDPRVAYGTDPSVPTGEFAHVPWLFQKKYTSTADNINLASGKEMRLIEAEALLRGGDWQGAVLAINAIRANVISDHTGNPLESWSANSAEDAWTHLKRERGIELFLEGRRMADLRRWIAESAPGEMEDMSDRVRLCFPIPNVERNTNPNVPTGHEDPVNPTFTG